MIFAGVLFFKLAALLGAIIRIVYRHNKKMSVF